MSLTRDQKSLIEGMAEIIWWAATHPEKMAVYSRQAYTYDGKKPYRRAASADYIPDESARACATDLFEAYSEYDSDIAGDVMGSVKGFGKNLAEASLGLIEPPDQPYEITLDVELVGNHVLEWNITQCQTAERHDAEVKRTRRNPGQRMTLVQAKAILRELGITLVKRDDEYEVFPRGEGNGSPKTYYTNDLDDAVATGRAMAAKANPGDGSKFVVMRFNRDNSDTYSHEIRDDNLAASIKYIIENTALPDPGSIIEYGIVTASDAGAARLMKPTGGWIAWKAKSGRARKNPPEDGIDTAEFKRVKVDRGWPETWEAKLRGWWYTISATKDGRWRWGFSHHRGDPDSQGSGTVATREIAEEQCRAHARA